MTPSNGNRIKGNKEVTGIGTASVIHQTAMSVATAAVAWAKGFMPPSQVEGRKKITTASTMPVTQPNLATANEFVDFSVVMARIAPVGRQE